MEDELRIIISGGGTGGHIFPAVSIANAIRAKYPEAKILFVGALGLKETQYFLERLWCGAAMPAELNALYDDYIGEKEWQDDRGIYAAC